MLKQYPLFLQNMKTLFNFFSDGQHTLAINQNKFMNKNEYTIAGYKLS
jgi:hypothetical protein